MSEEIADIEKGKKQDTNESVQAAVATPEPTTSSRPDEVAALMEPDPLSIVLGDSVNQPVKNDRKQRLLLQARADRRKWVQQIPLPFAPPVDPNNFWTRDDRLAKLYSSLACRHLPAVTKVLLELYGVEENQRTPKEIADRIEKLVRITRSFGCELIQVFLDLTQLLLLCSTRLSLLGLKKIAWRREKILHPKLLVKY